MLCKVHFDHLVRISGLNVQQHLFGVAALCRKTVTRSAPLILYPRLDLAGGINWIRSRSVYNTAT